ncbi:MAG: tRNA (adenosine(37)-N6)-threonylcarbamoyltransferase complex ATPase subunit type 1 TsaE [Candidatus Giovannonibacteria bacterium]|nr:tRNA (adenosine(37)-N6)-threonylcarbamoyltransferase complex ATPase subunit type 1 TsaE [Candidatus Giovannonibacteria bacterium]
MGKIDIFTKSDKETKKLGEALAKEIMKPSSTKATEDKLKTATVLSLEGDLGAGKTTFVQGFGKFLGIKERIQSPTFVILKIYKINKKANFKNFIHVDAYRLKSKDFKVFGWENFIKNKNNIILVEWGNKIKNILPKNSLRIIFKHGKNFSERKIIFKN